MNIYEIEKKVSEICGTNAKCLSTKELVFNPVFRKYCEENKCGMYGRNYMCPPDIGTFEEVKQRALKYEYVIFYSTTGAIRDFDDKENIKLIESRHNGNAEKITEFFRENIDKTILNVASKCSYCSECSKITNSPCKHPDKARACLSAYCIDVSKMSEKCGFEFKSDGKSLSFFGAALFCCDDAI